MRCYETLYQNLPEATYFQKSPKNQDGIKIYAIQHIVNLIKDMRGKIARFDG